MSTLEPLLSHLALHADGKDLLVSQHLSHEDIAIIRSHKAAIREKLKRSQTNEAGFYVLLPSVLETELRAASTAFISVHVTASTRYSAPERIGKGTRIGQHAWPEYRALNPGVRASSAPRIRAVAVLLEEIGTFAFDWDQLPSPDKQLFLSALLKNKIIAGHDLGRQLSWLFAETNIRPKYIADTSLLIRHIKPRLLLQPFARAASADPVKSAQAVALITKNKGGVERSLEYVAKCCSLPEPDSELNTPACWSLNLLSQHHRTSLDSRLRTIRTIYSYLFQSNPSPTVSGIEMAAPAYTPFSEATLRLAEAHARGVPFDAAAARTMLDQSCAVLKQDELLTSPGPSRKPNDSMCDLRKPAQTILKYLGRAAAGDGRVHSIITFATSTGRTTSQYPALQNLPRDPSWRRLIKARPGYAIMAVDYSTMEMRIAAALASRAVVDISTRLHAGDTKGNWFLQQAIEVSNSNARYAWPSATVSKGLDWHRALVKAAIQCALLEKSEVMKRALQEHIDLHLVTAVDFAKRLGAIEVIEPALDWLISHTETQRAEIKTQLAGQRQAAKACNFGLLYGMGVGALHRHAEENYGLSWSLANAASAYDAWYRLYPEITLWHLWTRHCQSRKCDPSRLRVWNNSEQRLITPTHPVPVYRCTTLLGRPFVGIENIRQMLAAQGQGTGADILALAISELPQEIADMLLFPVHDELVFEVPVDAISSVRPTVERVMIAAGTTVLGSDIPIELDTLVDETWG